MIYSEWHKVDSIEGDCLPPIGELVWGYDHRRGINVICWRAYKLDDSRLTVIGETWESYEFGDNIMITYWYPIKPYPVYPRGVVRSNATI